MKRDDHALWKPPTRRSFVALLGAGIAAIVVRARPRGDSDDDPPRSTWAGATRWIGHC